MVPGLTCLAYGRGRHRCVTCGDAAAIFWNCAAGGQGVPGPDSLVWLTMRSWGVCAN